MTTTVQPNAIILLIALMLLIPFLFRASKELTVDRWLGDLSYPIYVCKFMVIAWAERSRIDDLGVRHQIAWAAIVLISIVLLIAVDRPIELLRQRRAGKVASYSRLLDSFGSKIARQSPSDLRCR